MKKYCAYDEGTMKYEQLLCMIRRMPPPDEEVDSNQGVLFNHQLDDPDAIPAGSTYEVECKANAPKGPTPKANAVPTSKSSQLMSSMAYGKSFVEKKGSSSGDMTRKTRKSMAEHSEQFGRSGAPDAAKPKPGPKGQSTQSPKDDAEKSENADAVPGKLGNTGIEIVESVTLKRAPGKDAMQIQNINVKFNDGHGKCKLQMSPEDQQNLYEAIAHDATAKRVAAYAASTSTVDTTDDGASAASFTSTVETVGTTEDGASFTTKTITEFEKIFWQHGVHEAKCENDVAPVESESVSAPAHAKATAKAKASKAKGPSPSRRSPSFVEGFANAISNNGRRDGPKGPKVKAAK